MGEVTGNDDHCLHGDSICLNEFSAWNYCKMTRASASIKDNIAEELVNIHSTILRTRNECVVFNSLHVSRMMS